MMHSILYKLTKYCYLPIASMVLLPISGKTMEAMGKYLANNDIWCVIHNIRCNISEGIICQLRVFLINV